MLIGELSDPRIGFVTLTRVEVASDLSLAKAHVSVMGEGADERMTLAGLNSARKRVRSTLKDRLQLRRMPEILFCLDSGVKRSIRMSGILSELARERGEAPPSPEPEEPEKEPEEESKPDDQ